MGSRGTYLVEVEDARQLGVQPDGVARGLAELDAGGGGQERSSQAERGGDGGWGAVAHAVYEGDAGEDVPPLVGAAELDRAPKMLVQIMKVVRLEELVGELCEGDAGL